MKLFPSCLIQKTSRQIDFKLSFLPRVRKMALDAIYMNINNATAVA